MRNAVMISVPRIPLLMHRKLAKSIGSCPKSPEFGSRFALENCDRSGPLNRDSGHPCAYLRATRRASGYSRKHGVFGHLGMRKARRSALGIGAG